MNAYQETTEMFKPPILKITESVERAEKRKLAKLRKKRNHRKYSKAINDLKRGTKLKQNLIPKLLAEAEALATEGEIADAMKEEFGVCEPPSIF